jgi:hypothetical protein
MGKHVWDLPLEQAITDAMIIVKVRAISRPAFQRSGILMHP